MPPKAASGSSETVIATKLSPTKQTSSASKQKQPSQVRIDTPPSSPLKAGSPGANAAPDAAAAASSPEAPKRRPMVVKGMAGGSGAETVIATKVSPNKLSATQKALLAIKQAQMRNFLENAEKVIGKSADGELRDGSPTGSPNARRQSAPATVISAAAQLKREAVVRNAAMRAEGGAARFSYESRRAGRPGSPTHEDDADGIEHASVDDSSRSPADSFKMAAKRRQSMPPSPFKLLANTGVSMLSTEQALAFAAALGEDGSFRVSGSGLHAATVREEAWFTIECVHLSGHRMPRPGLPFSVSIRGVAKVRAKVHDDNNGLYRVRWKPVLSGHYSIAISLDGYSLPGSPFAVDAKTPEPNPTKCIVKGRALANAVARKTNTFEVQYKDSLGATTHAVDLDVFVEPVTPRSPRGAAWHEIERNSPDRNERERQRPEPPSEQAHSPPKSERGSESHRAKGKKKTAKDTVETRYRRIRVKVGTKPLLVRAGPDLSSEAIGQLLPGAIVTVIEERMLPGNVRGCVALDFMGKHDPKGNMSERGQTFRSFSNGDTFRANVTQGHPPEPSYRSEASKAPASNRSARSNHGGYLMLTSTCSVGCGTSSSTSLSSIGSPLGSAHLMSAISEPITTGLEPIPEIVGPPAGADPPLADLTPQDEEQWAAVNSERQKEEAAADYEMRQLQTRIQGAAHNKVQARYGMHLATDDLPDVTDAIPHRPPAVSTSPPPHEEAHYATASEDEDGDGEVDLIATGWVTLVKDGVKLVSSRLKLDVAQRAQHKGMWERRVGRHPLAHKPGTAPPQDTVLTLEEERLQRRLELMADPNSFAFGGVYPGTLHSHGNLRETHHVSYSIGIAGNYLLHVRLRNQASALPGSPFLLRVDPGPAFAMTTCLPTEVITCEAGEMTTVMLDTIDRMGNTCIEGGAKVTNDPLDDKKGSIKSKVVDNEDGSYALQWTCTKTGIFRSQVRVDGRPVINSPANLKVVSTKPMLQKCHVYPEQPGLTSVVVGVPATFRFKFYDQWENVVTPSQDFKDRFKTSVQLTKAKETIPTLVCEGYFVGEDGSEYEVKYSAGNPAAHVDLALYGYMADREDEKIHLPGSPFHISIGKNRNDANSKDASVNDTFVYAPQDYKIDALIFQAAQNRWGEMTVDAFASSATHVCPRFWTAKADQGAEHIDAFSSVLRWKRGERIWAHPPVSLIPTLLDLLNDPGRTAEVIVCVPTHSGRDWFYKLTKMADDAKKFPAGKLIRVAEDAPARLGEWPIELFHIPEPPKRLMSPSSSHRSRSPSPPGSPSAKLEAVPPIWE